MDWKEKMLCFFMVFSFLFVISFASPVEIHDWNDLDEIRNDLDEDYILMNDLDENTDGYEDAIPEAGFISIGSEEYPFTGSFDGQNYEIRDFKSEGLFEFIDDGEVVNISFEEFEFDVGNDGSIIAQKSRQSFFENIEIRDSNLSGNSRVGFISAVDKNSIFENIVIEDSSISCYERCGSLVGKGKQLLVFNNNVSNVDVTGNLISGGLVGQGFGEFGDNRVTDVYVDAQIGVGGVIGDATSFDFEDQWIDRTHFVFTRFWDTFLENVHLNNTHYDYDEEDLNRIESLDSELNRGGLVGMNYRSSDFEFEVSDAYMNIEFDEWVEDDADGHWASMVGVMAGDQEFETSSGEIDIDIDTVITNNLQIVDSNSGLLFHYIVDKFDEDLNWSLKVEDVLTVDTMPDGDYKSDYITISDHYRDYFDDFNVSNSYINRDNMDYTTSFNIEDFTVGYTYDLTYPYSAGFYTNWDFVNVWGDDYNSLYTDYNNNNDYPYLRTHWTLETVEDSYIEFEYPDDRSVFSYLDEDSGFDVDFGFEVGSSEEISFSFFVYDSDSEIVFNKDYNQSGNVIEFYEESVFLDDGNYSFEVSGDVNSELRSFEVVESDSELLVDFSDFNPDDGSNVYVSDLDEIDEDLWDLEFSVFVDSNHAGEIVFNFDGTSIGSVEYDGAGVYTYSVEIGSGFLDSYYEWYIDFESSLVDEVVSSESQEFFISSDDPIPDETMIGNLIDSITNWFSGTFGVDADTGRSLFAIFISIFMSGLVAWFTKDGGAFTFSFLVFLLFFTFAGFFPTVFVVVLVLIGAFILAFFTRSMLDWDG